MESECVRHAYHTSVPTTKILKKKTSPNYPLLKALISKYKNTFNPTPSGASQQVKKKLKRKTNKTTRPKNSTVAGVEPRSSRMQRLLLVYCATSANMKGECQIIIFKTFPLWRFAFRRSNMSRHLVIPTIFIQLKGATFIKIFSVSDAAYIWKSHFL